MLANIRRLIGFALIAILAFGALSCGNQSPQKKPETTASQKPPPELEKMKKDLAELGTLLEKRVREQEQGSSSQTQAAQPTGTEAGKESQKGSSQKEEKQQGQGTAAKSLKWEEEMTKVRDLHRDWNGLEPEAVAKGMTAPTQTALEKNMSGLTQAVENRRLMEAELAANQVYRYYVEAAALFKTGIPPNLERIRYHVIETRLQGSTDNWEAAGTEAGKAAEMWLRLSYSLTKIDRQKLNQMEYSLTDLAEAAAQRSMVLTFIKNEIALQNLDEMERRIKSAAGGQS